MDDKITFATVIASNPKLGFLLIFAALFTVVLIFVLILIALKVLNKRDIQIGNVSLTRESHRPPEDDTAHASDGDALEGIIQQVQVSRIVSVTKQCIQSAVSYMERQEDISSDVKKKQITKASELTSLVMNDIKYKYSEILQNMHSGNRSFDITMEADYNRINKWLERDFDVSVDETFRTLFNKETLGSKNDLELDELSQKLAAAAITSLREAIMYYNLDNKEELLKIFHGSEQSLREAINNALKAGRKASQDGQNEIKRECERHNAEINRILANSLNLQNVTEEEFISDKDREE